MTGTGGLDDIILGTYPHNTSMLLVANTVTFKTLSRVTSCEW
jgi:hypothetical protein